MRVVDGVVVRVTTAVFDPGPFLARAASPPPVAAFVGTMERGPTQAALEPGTTVVGVGPLRERLTLSPTELWPVGEAQRPEEALALIPFLGPIADGLAALGVGLGDRGLVSGRGLTARLAADAMERVTGRAPARVTPPGDATADGSAAAVEVDVLVDATGDPTWWAHILPRVRREGRVLLLLPPGPHVHHFDFYHRVHRGSFALAARRVPSLGDTVAGAALLSRMLNDGALAPAEVFRGITVGYDPGGASPPLDLVPEGMGVAVRFEAVPSGAGSGGQD